jgi:TetR/AcrR family transcriptional regulator, mexJK operon transcriptional repressor
MAIIAPQTRSDKKRLQIRAAAKQLFLQHGFQSTTTDAIAAAAAVSKETLYRYYTNKQDLFLDVLRSLTVDCGFWVELLDRSTEPKTRQEFRALLRTTLHGLLETMMQPDYVAILRLIVAESPRFPELGDLFRRTVLEQGFRYFITLLRSGQRNGVVRQDIDPSTVTRMLLGTLLTFVLPNGLIQTTQAHLMPDEGAVDACVDHVLELVSMRKRK